MQQISRVLSVNAFEIGVLISDRKSVIVSRVVCRIGEAKYGLREGYAAPCLNWLLELMGLSGRIWPCVSTSAMVMCMMSWPFAVIMSERVRTCRCRQHLFNIFKSLGYYFHSLKKSMSIKSLHHCRVGTHLSVAFGMTFILDTHCKIKVSHYLVPSGVLLLWR